MTGKYTDIINTEIIAKENIELWGNDGTITRQDNAYFRTQIGNLVILGMAFIVNSPIPAFSTLLSFNSYTGTPTGNVFGSLSHVDGSSTSVFMDGPDMKVSSAMGVGQWRGFIVYGVNT